MDVGTSGSIVTLIPGDGRRKLHVHPSLLCKHSVFFKHATKKEWNGGEDPKNIPLPTDSFDTVKVFTDWLYSGTIGIGLYEAGTDLRKKVAEEAEKVFVRLAEAYVFREKCVAVVFKNAVMETILAAIESSGWHMGPASVRIVYDGTLPNSPLRRLVADEVALIGYDDSERGVGWIESLDEYPEEALREALVRTLQLREPNTEYVIEARQYLEEEVPEYAD